MDYTIESSECGKFIVLTSRGDIGRESAMRQNLEAHAFGKKLGIHRYLVDLRESRNTESTMDQYSFAYEDMIQADSIDRGAIVAVVVAEGDHSHDFIETVLVNAGWNFRLFSNMEEAERHLREHANISGS